MAPGEHSGTTSPRPATLSPSQHQQQPAIADYPANPEVSTAQGQRRVEEQPAEAGRAVPGRGLMHPNWHAPHALGVAVFITLV